MALSDIDLAKIKVDFESGKLSKRKIAQKFSISRNTLDKHSKEKKWLYGFREQELSQKIELLTLEKLIKDEVDRAAVITNKFLSNADKYNQLVMRPASELAKAYNKAEKAGTVVKKKEFSRIWESAKAIKTAIEGLKIVYDGQRKALGMDRDEDIRKAKEIKLNDNVHEALDPLAGMTEEEIDKEIEKLS